MNSIQFHQEATQTLSSLVVVEDISSENKRSEIKYLRRNTNRLFLVLRAVVAKEIWNSWIYPFQQYLFSLLSPNCMTFPFRIVIFHDIPRNMRAFSLLCFHHCHNAFRHQNRCDFSQFYLPYSSFNPIKSRLNWKCAHNLFTSLSQPACSSLNSFHTQKTMLLIPRSHFYNSHILHWKWSCFFIAGDAFEMKKHEDFYLSRIWATNSSLTSFKVAFCNIERYFDWK